MTRQAERKPERKYIGYALALCAHYQDKPRKELADETGIPLKRLHEILDGYLSTPQEYQNIADKLGYSHPTDALVVSRYIENTVLTHWEHFPEILKAYRKTKGLSQGEMGQITAPHREDANKLVSAIETRQELTGPVRVLHLLKKLGFATMGDFIRAAGVEKEYPLDAEMPKSDPLSPATKPESPIAKIILRRQRQLPDGNDSGHPGP